MTGSAAPASLGYILLIAALTSIAALATDVMLPALDQMTQALEARNATDGHNVVISFFLGMALGQLVVGPLSDTFGRRPVIFGGYAIFVLGCAISWMTEDWTAMLAARVLQGIGASAPRSVTIAMVRDQYEGRAMARVMSIAFAAFIIVPIIAPALGELVIAIGGWRATFVALALGAVLVSLWYGVALPETLPPERRVPFRVGPLWSGLKQVLGSRVAMGYTLTSAFIFVPFTAYLGTAQQVFEGVFLAGELFALYFAIAAASIGLASLLNASLVMRLGMRRLTWVSLLGLSALSVGFWALLPLLGGVPPFWAFMTWLLLAFFCIGIVFGNLNALALEPLGHIAGLGSAIVGSLAMLLSLPPASWVSAMIVDTVTPLVAGFALMGLASVAMMWWTARGQMS